MNLLKILQYISLFCFSFCFLFVYYFCWSVFCTMGDQLFLTGDSLISFIFTKVFTVDQNKTSKVEIVQAQRAFHSTALLYGYTRTCAGVPGLNKTPDDGAALVTCLFDALALLLREAMLQEDPQVGLILFRVLTHDKAKYHTSTIFL